MVNGMYAVMVYSGSVSVLRFGWFARAGGDEWRVWWSTPYRGETTTRIPDVCLAGPKSAPRWEWSPLVESYASRFHFAPLAKLDEAVWGDHFPKPAEWTP